MTTQPDGTDAGPSTEPALDAASPSDRGLDNSNTIRAGVFGIQDGVVSNFGLVMGVAGASISPGAVVIAGVAGLVSGAISMGAGEYVSVRTQAELLETHRVVASEQENVSPYRAAAANGLLFALGGMFPLLPFVLADGVTAVAISITLSILVLFGAGALLTRLTRRSPVRSGLRLLFIGGGAGLLGFLIGTLLGGVVDI